MITVKLFGLDLKTTEGKLKLFILAAGLSIFFVAVSAGALEITSTPKFCSLCHEMQPEYVTWKASAHANITCTNCHVEPGTANFINHKINSLKQVYYHFTGNYIQPIEISEPIKNEVCLQCHTTWRRVNAPGDIKFPHQQHLAEKLNCVDCHSGVVHGNIEPNGFTTATDYNSWTPGVGKAYMQPRFTNVQMEQCIDCHQSRDVPVTCNTCHTKLIKPASHLKSDWLQKHGPQAEEGFQACDQCHSKTGSWVHNSDDPGVQGYIRNNTFCLDCHAKNKPPGHTADWRNVHGPQAKANQAGCLACHMENRVPPNLQGLVPKDSCATCHARPMHQGINNPGMHPFPLKGQPISAKCATCHPKDVCGQCHYFDFGTKKK